MASEKKPSIYYDRGTIGSSKELDEYGVWVKSEPQVLSAASAGPGEKTRDSSDLSLPDLDTIVEEKDFPAEDFSIEEDFSAGESGADSFSIEEDPLDIPADESLDILAEDSFDILAENPFDIPAEDSPDIPAEGSAEPEKGFSEISLEDWGSSETPPEPLGVEKTAAEINRELEAREQIEEAAPFAAATDRDTPDLSTQLLMKIADELASIRNELSTLKSELSTIRPGDSYGAEHGEPQGHGFFDEEDDEKTALTGDELDNILNTADFTEEAGADATEDTSNEITLDLSDHTEPEPLDLGTDIVEDIPGDLSLDLGGDTEALALGTDTIEDISEDLSPDLGGDTEALDLGTDTLEDISEDLSPDLGSDTEALDLGITVKDISGDTSPDLGGDTEALDLGTDTVEDISEDTSLDLGSEAEALDLGITVKDISEDTSLDLGGDEEALDLGTDTVEDISEDTSLDLGGDEEALDLGTDTVEDISEDISLDLGGEAEEKLPMEEAAADLDISTLDISAGDIGEEALETGSDNFPDEAAGLGPDDESLDLSAGAELIEALQDTSYLEEDPLAFSDTAFDENSIDLSNAIIDEPDLGAVISEEPLEEPSLDDLSLDDDSEEETSLDPHETETPVSIDLDLEEAADGFDGENLEGEGARAFGDSEEEMELSISEDPLSEDTLSEDFPEPELPVELPASEEDDALPPEEESFAQVIPEGFVVEDAPVSEESTEETEAAIDDGFESSLDSDLEAALNSGIEEAVGESLIQGAPAPAEDALEAEALGDLDPDAISGNFKQELKTVLSYMDQLLESLPEEKIEEFAKSEYFDTYKKLFKELGIV
ncbi:hypothetical protein AGMMS50268_26240 [Spirochaetia bacterium]|nr:hypothetical protein AGMMS50268_26240 [Spirochaetia bacterium]